MLEQSWEEILHQRVFDPPTQGRDQPIKVAVLGMGNALHGDDAAGVEVAARLQKQLENDHCLILDGGMAPENCTGQLRRFLPDWILIIDAAQMGLKTGSVGWVPWEETAGISASTHTLPIHILAQYLVQELNCQVALIGIQPFQTALGAPLSPGVRLAVGHIVRALSEGLASGRSHTAD